MEGMQHRTQRKKSITSGGGDVTSCGGGGGDDDDGDEEEEGGVLKEAWEMAWKNQIYSVEVQSPRDLAQHLNNLY